MKVCTIQHGLLKVCGIGIKFGRARSFTNFLSFFQQELFWMKLYFHILFLTRLKIAERYYTKHNSKLLLTVCLKIEPNNTSKFITLISTYFCNHVYFELYSTEMHCFQHGLWYCQFDYRITVDQNQKEFWPKFYQKKSILLIG